MRPIAVCDVETDPFKRFRSPKCFLAGWFNGTRTRTFWETPKLEPARACWESMRKELRGYLIYWHNGGKFDARYFFRWLKEDGFKLKPIKGRMARFVHKDGTEFLDSFCLLPVSLKATGEKMDMDYRLMERDVREQHKEKIIRYWKNDLQITYDKVSEFIAEYGFGMTMAGRTFDQLKKRFGIEPPKTGEYYDRQFRRFYYGGRVEFFKLGKLRGKFKLIDINSAYPCAMTQKHAFGTDFMACETLPKSDEILNTCFVRFNGVCEGGLPHRLADGSLSFGPHSGEFFVTGWELVAARRAGVVSITEVIECLRPVDTRDFKKFVDYFYRQKREAVKGSSEELFAKLFLNSAYGRFALNPREFRDVIMTDYRVDPDENNQLRKKIKGYILRRYPGIHGDSFAEKCKEVWEASPAKWTLANDFEDIGVSIWERAVEVRSNAFFNVATAASITGCVRAKLFESLRQVSEPVYCDTDSIICRDAGNLSLGADLGEWKLECESVRDGVWIAGKKLYAFRLAEAWRKKGKQWKLASKGVKLSADEICRAAMGETIKTTSEAPTFSLFTTRAAGGSKADFITRTVRRDDLRKRRNVA